MLFLAPMYGISYYLMGELVNNLEEQLSRSLTAQLGTTLAGIEQDIERVINQCNHMVNDGEILRLSTAASSLNLFERSEYILGIREKLNTIQETSSYMEDIRILLPSINRSISGCRGIDTLSEEETERIDDANFDWGTPLFETNPQYWLRYPMSLHYPAWFAVCIELSEDRLRSALEPLHLYEDSHVALMDQERRYKLSNDPEQNMDWVDLTAQQEGGHSEILQWEGEEYLSILAHSGRSPFSIAVLYPRAKAQQVIDHYRNGMLVFTLFSAFLMALTVESIRRVIYRPMSQMMTSQQAMTDRAELKQLQSQINPHFLYNVFFMIGNIAQAEDSPETMEFARQLGVYFQYITRNASEFVPLKQEVEHARLYCQIQQTRYSNRIEVDFGELPREWAEFSVPRLFIQPFLENAFEHGLKNCQKGGVLRVGFENAMGQIRLFIEDNGEVSEEVIERLNGGEPRDGSEITAVLNIRRRLCLIYGEAAKLTFERSPLGGLRVNILLGG